MLVHPFLTLNRFWLNEIESRAFAYHDFCSWEGGAVFTFPISFLPIQIYIYVRFMYQITQ